MAPEPPPPRTVTKPATQNSTRPGSVNGESNDGGGSEDGGGADNNGASRAVTDVGSTGETDSGELNGGGHSKGNQNIRGGSNGAGGDSKGSEEGGSDSDASSEGGNSAFGGPPSSNQDSQGTGSNGDSAGSQSSSDDDIGGIIASNLNPMIGQAGDTSQPTLDSNDESEVSSSDQAGSGAIVQLGSVQVTAGPVGTAGGISVAGKTLSAGQVATIDGHIVKNGGNNVVVDGSTVHVARVTAAPAQSGAVITGAAGTMIAFASDGTAVVAGHTLTPDQARVVDGQTFSDVSTGIVVDGQTVAFSRLPAWPTIGTVFTINRHVYITTILPNGHVVCDGTTLCQNGAAASFGGVRVNDGRDGLVVGSRTLPASTLSADVTGADRDTVPTAYAASTTESWSLWALGVGFAVGVVVLI